MSFFNNVGAVIKAIKDSAEKMGILSNLNTTEKTNLVGAINEVDDRVDIIITTPVESVSAQEIIDARQGKTTLGESLDNIKIIKSTTPPNNSQYWLDTTIE